MLGLGPLGVVTILVTVATYIENLLFYICFGKITAAMLVTLVTFIAKSFQNLCFGRGPFTILVAFDIF